MFNDDETQFDAAPTPEEKEEAAKQFEEDREFVQTVLTEASVTELVARTFDGYALVQMEPSLKELAGQTGHLAEYENRFRQHHSSYPDSYETDMIKSVAKENGITVTEKHETYE